MNKPIYVCHQCNMPIRSDEPTRIDQGKFFHTHRDCHRVWVEIEAKRKSDIERVAYRDEE